LIKLKDEACHEYLTKLGQLCMIFIITNDLYNIKNYNMIQSYKQNPLLQESMIQLLLAQEWVDLRLPYFLAKGQKCGPKALYAWWFYMFFKRKGYEWDVGMI
jgi:hypothetical protein